MSNEFVEMTQRQKIELMMAGEVLELPSGGTIYFSEDHTHGPFVFEINGSTDRAITALSIKALCRIKTKAEWVPEFDELVLCRGAYGLNWLCGRYSHEDASKEGHYLIGGFWMKEIAPFDKTKLGKV